MANDRSTILAAIAIGLFAAIGLVLFATSIASAAGVDTERDLLPGVELAVDEVLPSVFLVVGDGTGHRLTGMSIRRLEVTTDGQVWLEIQAFGRTTDGKKNPDRGFVGVFRLGVPGPLHWLYGVRGPYVLPYGGGPHLLDSR